MNATANSSSFILEDGLTARLSHLKSETVFQPDELGAIGQLSPGKYELEVLVSSRYRYFVLHANKQNNITGATPIGSEPGVRAKYFHDVIVQNAPRAFTRFPDNHIRVLKMRPGGLLNLYELALVAQEGNFWVSFQQTWETRAYADGDRVVLPELSKWETLMAWLTEHRKELGKLAPVSEYIPAPDTAPDTAHLSPNEGVVKFFSRAKGWGVISTAKGDAFVHWRDCPETISGERKLEKGQRITFSLLEPNDSESMPFKVKHVFADE